jgi:hypothetical protein
MAEPDPNSWFKPFLDELVSRLRTEFKNLVEENVREHENSCLARKHASDEQLHQKYFMISKGSMKKIFFAVIGSATVYGLLSAFLRGYGINLP